jgi:hypothetical protein
MPAMATGAVRVELDVDGLVNPPDSSSLSGQTPPCVGRDAAIVPSASTHLQCSYVGSGRRMADPR